MKLVGIDIGTTSICGVVVDTEDRRLLHSVTEQNRSQIESEEASANLQDAGEICRVVDGVLQRILREHPDVSAIGVSGQMHGIVYVDAAGQAISPLYTWQDGRGNWAHADGGSYVERLSQMTGYTLATGYGLVTHYVHACTGTIPATAITFCTIGDYVVANLTGRRRPVVDITNAASLGIYRDGGFDTTALGKARIEPNMLPEVVPSGTLVGETPAGVPVFTAIGDNQASYLGAVDSPYDTLLLNVGTGAQLSVWSDHAITAPNWETRPYPGNGWLNVAASLGGGKSYALLEKFFREICALFGDASRKELYERMNDALEMQEGVADPMAVTPLFFGTRQQPHLRGSITNISEHNFTPQGLMRAWIAGIASEFKSYFDDLPSDLRGGVVRMVGSGNGIGRNRALQQAIEQQFGLKLEVVPFEEEAATGAALCAGVGLGEFPSFLETGRWFG